MCEERILECVHRTQTPLGLVREELLDEIEGVLALSPRPDGRQIRKKPGQVYRGDFDERHFLSVRELFECLGNESAIEL